MAMTTGTSAAAWPTSTLRPMIDILLVLLIIFMVIVPVTPKGLDALVPQPPKNPQSRQTRRSHHRGPGSVPGRQYPHLQDQRDRGGQARVVARLTEIYANRAERVMFVRGDDDVNFRVHRGRDRYRPRRPTWITSG